MRLPPIGAAVVAQLYTEGNLAGAVLRNSAYIFGAVLPHMPSLCEMLLLSGPPYGVFIWMFSSSLLYEARALGITHAGCLCKRRYSRFDLVGEMRSLRVWVAR